MGFIEWFEAGGLISIGVAVYLALSLTGHIVGMFDGPNPDDGTSKALNIVNKLLGFLRAIGIGTFKNEPGSNSWPLVPDSGERVVMTETVKPK